MEINHSNTLYKTGPREGAPYFFSLESEREKNPCCTSAELAATVREVYFTVRPHIGQAAYGTLYINGKESYKLLDSVQVLQEVKEICHGR